MTFDREITLTDKNYIFSNTTSVSIHGPGVGGLYGYRMVHSSPMSVKDFEDLLKKNYLIKVKGPLSDKSYYTSSGEYMEYSYYLFTPEALKSDMNLKKGRGEIPFSKRDLIRKLDSLLTTRKV